WASTGNTSASPTKNANEPITRMTATKSPQAAIISGLRRTALTDVCTATIAPTSRSSSSGKETTLIVSTKTANRKPMPFPAMMRIQPSEVVKMSLRNCPIDSGDMAEQRLVEPLCGGEPDQEHDHQDHSEGGDAVEGRASQHSEGVLPRNIDTFFALPAQFGRWPRRGGDLEWQASLSRSSNGCEARGDAMLPIPALITREPRPVERSVALRPGPPSCMSRKRRGLEWTSAARSAMK